MPDLAAALLALDIALTGARREFALQNHRNAKIADFLEGGREFYLSDGGYSRVCRDVWNGGRLFLTSNSTPRVKARWAECAAERALVESIAATLCPLD